MTVTNVTKVLVVEDEVITARVIAEELKLLGYIVTDTVGSYRDVLTSVNQNLPDVVLMDIVLKGSELDGIQIASILRQEFQIPIIYITSHTDDATLERAKDSEPFGYLVKPFDERDLRVTLEIAIFKHRMERQLAEREEMLSTILRSTYDAVIATNNLAEVTYMNPAAEYLTGWQQSEALGQEITNVVRLIDEIKDEEIVNPVLKVLQSSQVAYLNEYTALIDRQGIKKPVGDSASPLHKNNQTVDGVVLIFQNISDRRNVESLQIEKAEIRRAFEKEQELNELKSKLMAITSHEIRTPLSSILLSAELLEKPNLTVADRQKRVFRIKESTIRLNKLLEDMLTLDEFTLEISTFQPTLLNLEQFCLDLVEEINLVHLNDRDIRPTLVLSSQRTNQSVCMDQDLLHHILVNVLSNAIKYSPNGGNIVFEITYESRSNGEQADNQPSSVIFRIQDEGIGIPTDDLPFIFDFFRRATNTQKISGTGLGLAIVKRAVDVHGGQIAVESAIGQGTTFIITLPIS